MSESSTGSGAGQSECHDLDSGQVRKNNLEATKEGLVAKSKDEAPLTGNERIAFWREKMKKQGGDQDAPLAKDDDRDDNGISEDWDLTPLHKLLQDSQDDDYCSRELEKRLDEWKDIVDIRSPERQETALDMAVQKGFNKTARQLLTAMAEDDIEDGSGELPLQLACDSGDEQLVKMLLENGADPNKTVDGAHWTPLNIAIYDGHENVVDALLEGGASLRIQDPDGWTPLMTAIRARQHNTFHKFLQHLKKDPTEWDVINTPDNNGRTPLMQLCADEPGEWTAHAIEHLFGMNPDVDITDEEGMTVLHYTMISFSYRRFTETNPYEGVALELIDLLSVERLLHLDKYGETAFDIAFDENKQSQIPAFELLLNSLVGRLVKDEFIEEPLCWAVYRLERHMFALDLFQKNFADDIRQDPDREQWAIVEWAIYARMPRVLQTYLRTLGMEKVVSEDDKIDRSIRNGRKLIKASREKGRKVSATLTEGKKRNEDCGLTSGDDSSQDAEVLRDMEDILDYLHLEKVEKPSKPLELSKPDKGMKASLDKFRAAIIQSTFVKFRTIQDILYDDGSMSHMQDIAKRLKKFDYTPHISSEESSQTSKEPRENTSARAQFTWIHLPSTNMVWMEDMAKKILKEEGCGKSEAEKVASFLRSSWIEIPDRTSTSRFMRPRYVVKKADIATEQDAEDKNELKGKSIAVSAIYIPYLYFSTYHQSESGEQMVDTTVRSDHERRVQYEIRMRQELFKAYENSVIHQPMTLDEFYYQFASDEESVRDRNSRNKDQVVTRYLLPGNIEQERFWPLLRVDQLWAWTIDEKHVRSQVQDGSLQSRPDSATEMSKVIVDYCIGTYDREYRHQGRERSIHQIFTDSIIEIGRNGSVIAARETKPGSDDEDISEMMKMVQALLKAVEYQLRHIRDIRDELNIIMSIAKSQSKVQSAMAGSGVSEDLLSHHVLGEVEQLVKTTLTLQESDIASLQTHIANWQANQSIEQGMESVKQGKQAVKQGKIVLCTYVCLLIFWLSYPIEGRASTTIKNTYLTHI
ncbi:hypothetical protein CEP53_000312 [Fusarium sp. AF-6]|nr:hypothetical protein CEP53_000312 [Fusarium sp. AF-6]